MGRPLSIAELARLILPKEGQSPVMALLRAYFDASFSRPSQRARITCIGGYIGPEDEWLKVEAQWNAMLAHWNLEEFHLAPLLAGRLSVSQADAEACALSFAKIIRRSKLRGVVAALRDDDWLTIEKSANHLARFPTPYHQCLHMLFEVLEQCTQLHFPGDPFAVVLDLDKGEGAPTTAILDELRANPLCASVAFGRRSQFPLIQCADLCAGLVRREWLEHGFLPSSPPTRLSIEALATQSMGNLWSLETAKYIADMMERVANHRAARTALN